MALRGPEQRDGYRLEAGRQGLRELAFYPDWPAPGYYDTMVAGVQELINGSKSPSQVLDELAKPYNDNLADIGK